jgi:D-arabinose 1-dehydrogenase-like Zn-dependent alcohol dehydrogenase
MRSFQVCQCGAPLECIEQPTPKPTGTEVLLKVLAAGVCHSDLHLSDGYFDLGGGKKLSIVERGMKLPVTLGHENVGEVVAIGPDARGVNTATGGWSIPGRAAVNAGICRRGDDSFVLSPPASACSATAATART